VEHPLYIACINLSGRRCVVVGGGDMALEKVDGLLLCDADVTVVSPKLIPELQAYVDEGTITWRQGRYEATDLEGALLVICATRTDDDETNNQVASDAEKRGMLVNIVDVPHLCNFILPAIVREGPLAIAISTAGASPALAKRIKARIADEFGPAYATLADIMREQRPWAKSNLATYDDRKEFFEEIVNGSPDPIELIERGRTDEFHRHIEQVKAAHLGKRTTAHT